MNLPEALLLSLFLGLGTARMAAIVSIDKIAEPLRDLVFHWFPPEDNDKEGWYYQSLRPATDEEQLRRDSWEIPWWQKRWEPGDVVRKPAFLGELISCHRCTSVWIAAGNALLYWAWRDAAIALNVVMSVSFIASASDTHFYKR